MTLLLSALAPVMTPLHPTMVMLSMMAPLPMIRLPLIVASTIVPIMITMPS
jgi:hypothetical protein